MDQIKKQYRPLEKMFNEVPGRYDRMNRLLTLSLDQPWRRKAADICLGGSPEHIMDICTGTGDLALIIAKKAGADKKIIALDFSRPMLEIAARKASKRGLTSIETVYGDVAELPYPDNYFDAVSIGFAFRNLTYKNPRTDMYLKEILRVIKKGGKFVIVESSQPGNRFVTILFRLYLKIFVEKIGGWISGHNTAYRYLAHSAKHFYTPQEIHTLLKDNGFSRVDSYPLTMGVAAIHVAIK